MIEYKKKFKIGKLEVSACYRPKHKNLLGRFGGGFNWNLGFEIGSRCMIVYLLICYIRFDLNESK